VISTYIHTHTHTLTLKLVSLACGQIFCWKCSSYEHALPESMGYGVSPVRVCVTCFNVYSLRTKSLGEPVNTQTQHSIPYRTVQSMKQYHTQQSTAHSHTHIRTAYTQQSTAHSHTHIRTAYTQHTHNIHTAYTQHTHSIHTTYTQHTAYAHTYLNTLFTMLMYTENHVEDAIMSICFFVRNYDLYEYKSNCTHVCRPLS